MYSVPILSIGVLIVTVILLRRSGRVWTKGTTYILEPSANAPSTSQALFDPYALSHILHGLVLYAAFHRLAPEHNFLASLTLEAVWEVVENSSFVINKYRQNTASLDYYGDSILNTGGDLVSMIAGWFLAKYLPIQASIGLFLAIELIMLRVWKDNLTMNVLMLLYPVDAIKTWQLGREI